LVDLEVNMAIKTEIVGTFDYKRKLVRVYSDVGLQIQEVGSGDVHRTGEVFFPENSGKYYFELHEKAVSPPIEENLAVHYGQND
jgi:hypothetical protein